MAAPKRSKIQRERDRLTIADLHLKGWNQQKIADFLELNKSNICRELKKIRAAWQAETIEQHGLYVQKELKRLSMLEAEYWSAWERSQQSKESSLKERLGLDGDGESRVKIAKRTEQRVGDPAFLTGVQKVIDSRCKLLGLHPDAHSQDANNPTGTGGGLSDSAADVIRSQILGIRTNAQPNN